MRVVIVGATGFIGSTLAHPPTGVRRRWYGVEERELTTKSGAQESHAVEPRGDGRRSVYRQRALASAYVRGGLQLGLAEEQFN